MIFPVKVINVFQVFSNWVLIAQTALANVYIRETIVLTNEEQKYLKLLIQSNEEAQRYWMQIQEEARRLLNDQSQTLKVIHYEGLLDTHPKRIETEKSLEDMDNLALLLFAYYGTHDNTYAQKAKEYILSG